MGVAEIAKAVAEKRLSPVDITQQLLSRISQYDGKLRAWSYLVRETTIIEAQAMADEAEKGELRGPLHGVPFGIKEQFALGGAPSLANWTDPNPLISEEDATVVARLKAAGALVVGKTFMVNQVGMPPTKNPWNLEYSPGGSSSGSGAAVGARMVPFAMSEQTGGSGIRPAAYNGVAGLKPTFGRNSRFGMFTLSYSQDHPCTIATSVSDLIPVFAVTAGHDPKDPTSRFDGAFKGDVTLTKPPKIGVVRNFFPDMTEPEMQSCIEAAAEKLAAGGAEVVDFYLPEDAGKNAAMNADTALGQGRGAYDRQAWADAYALLSVAGRETPLAAEDLIRLAIAADLIGKDTEAADLWTRAHHDFVRRGETAKAARCAFWLALFALLVEGEVARSGGWIARGRRLLEEDPQDCGEQGYLLLPAALRGLFFEGDAASASKTFDEAASFGRRFGDPDLICFARLGQGQSLLRLGRTSEGTALLDEVMSAVMAGELSTLAVGIVYCGVLLSCQEIFDLWRAEEWTAAFTR